MGALLSLPLLAVPSMGTVRVVPGAFVCTPLMGHLSYSVSALHAAEQLLAQQYAAYAESFRAGSLSLTYGHLKEKYLTPLTAWQLE